MFPSEWSPVWKAPTEGFVWVKVKEHRMSAYETNGGSFYYLLEWDNRVGFFFLICGCGYVCICGCMHIHIICTRTRVIPQHTCRGQRTTFVGWFFGECPESNSSNQACGSASLPINHLISETIFLCTICFQRGDSTILGRRDNVK